MPAIAADTVTVIRPSFGSRASLRFFANASRWCSFLAWASAMTER